MRNSDNKSYQFQYGTSTDQDRFAKLRELLGDLYPLFLLIFNFFEK